MGKAIDYIKHRIKTPKEVWQNTKDNWALDKVLYHSNWKVALLSWSPLTVLLGAAVAALGFHSIRWTVILFVIFAFLYFYTTLYWIQKASEYIRNKEGIGKSR